jgi:hypothetical protein
MLRSAAGAVTNLQTYRHARPCAAACRFPDWDYVPPDDTCPFEYKASDWGRLPDGQLVALDYSATALSSPDEFEAALDRLDR